MQAGDSVVQANGRTPKSIIELSEQLASSPRGAALAILRNNERKVLSVQLVPETSVFNEDFIFQKLGVRLQNTTNAFAVVSVDSSSPAAAVLQSGYFVTAIDGKPLVNLTDAAKLLYSKKKGDQARLVVGRLQTRAGFSAYSEGYVDVPVIR